ncbi:hypothetical protein D9599_17230 [Roseomonas sp. KE2513]|uniref:hypothetical protein n=1 Tax=Roseomonas sp. KE2513 TaxID=2479202 RepID=UPI0018DFC669|nr:hypothetical protein [Roseomonas sp. KE2513]MBI0537310.1 hypothetical protein [Roseomonas sp. KE2513]
MAPADVSTLEPRISPSAAGLPRLSVLLCVGNEAGRIESLLSALPFADEVILVADRSTDGTVRTASRLGAVVVEGAWATEGDRKRAGLDAALGEWVLELEPEERPDARLLAAIREIVDVTVGADYHRVRVEPGSGGAVRLYRRGAKSWSPDGSRVLLHGVEGPPLAGVLRRLGSAADGPPGTHGERVAPRPWRGLAEVALRLWKARRRSSAA